MKFTKHDKAKARLDLLPVGALEIVGYALRHGAITYAPNNWKKCKDPGRYLAAMLRHAFKHMNGDLVDRESGLLHLGLAATNALFALELFTQLGHSKGMGRQFSYFGLIERKSKRKGIVKKRFRSFEKAWKYLTEEGLDPLKAFVKTIEPSQKVGDLVNL
jgi:hypothetical protein